MFRQTFLLLCLLVAALVASAFVHSGETVSPVSLACADGPPQAGVIADHGQGQDRNDSPQNEDAGHLPHQHGGCHGHHQTLDIVAGPSHDGRKFASVIWPTDGATSLLDVADSDHRPPIA